MGLGGRRSRARRRRARRRRAARRRRRHGGGGLGKLFLMCCGGGQTTDPIEKNREEILELGKAQGVILSSLHQQGTISIPPNYGQSSGNPSSGTMGQQPSGQAVGTGGAPPTGFGATNAVAPDVAVGDEDIKCHQSNQMQLLNEIGAQHSIEKNQERMIVICSQYNDLVQQMKVMESFGYTYPDGIPPMLQVAGNDQSVPVQSTDPVPMS